MVTADISVVPIGTDTTSLSEFVAESEKILKNFPDIKTRLNSMGTELECKDIDELFDVLKKMHLAPFNKETLRVYTIIKIDDRRDKESSMEEKIESVMKKV